MTMSRLDEAITARRNARRVLSREQVAAVYDSMAAAIAAELADANPVVLAVMNGGAFTATELCRRFDFPYDFGYVHASRYANRLTGGDVEWHVEPRADLEGREVLLVDDILDVGVTLAALERALNGRGVAHLYKAVFAVKTFDHPVERTDVDFEGARIPNVYVFGCGMDYKGYWRGLPELLAATDEAAAGQVRR
jgi:hypoxanthine phosphoribosyltransferase